MVGTAHPKSLKLIETRVQANGIDFVAFECGTGPLALCLHGFPDTAHTWRHLLPALAGEGFRAVAPFMRGYWPTSLALDGAYQTAALANDANALHAALGADSNAVIIGHDWGALAAYGAATIGSDKWRRVVGISVPPWGALGNAFLTNLTQLQRSWYMFVFQHPLADFLVAANDFAFIELLWKQWSPGYAGEVDSQHLKDSLSDPLHMQAALGYYRATLGSGYRDPTLADAQNAMQSESPPQPTLYLHGANDGCIGVEVAHDASSRAPENCSTRIVENAGHFAQLEQPDSVNKLILEWITK